MISRTTPWFFGHCKARDLDAARKLQVQMSPEGLKPNYTITNDAMLLELYRYRRMGEITALLDEKMTQGIVLDEFFTSSILLKILATMDEDSFLHLFEKPVKMYATTADIMLFNGLCEVGKVSSAEKVLDKSVEGSVTQTRTRVSESDSDSRATFRKSMSGLDKRVLVKREGKAELLPISTWLKTKRGKERRKIP